MICLLEQRLLSPVFALHQIMCLERQTGLENVSCLSQPCKTTAPSASMQSFVMSYALFPADGMFIAMSWGQRSQRRMVSWEDDMSPGSVTWTSDDAPFACQPATSSPLVEVGVLDSQHAKTLYLPLHSKCTVNKPKSLMKVFPSIICRCVLLNTLNASSAFTRGVGTGTFFQFTAHRFLNQGAIIVYPFNLLQNHGWADEIDAS